MCHMAKSITQVKESYSCIKCRYLGHLYYHLKLRYAYAPKYTFTWVIKKEYCLKLCSVYSPKYTFMWVLKRGDTNKISPALNTLSPKHYIVTFSLICLFHFILPHLRNLTNPSASLVVRVQDSSCRLHELWALERQV